MRIRFSILIGAALSVAACDDGFGPQAWDDTPRVFTLFSASRPDLLGQPSAFDAVSLQVVEVEAPSAAGNWDVVLGEQNGQLVLIPAAAFEGQNSRDGIATITGQTFESLTEAPGDTARYSSAPVPIQTGGVYVLRTRRYACSFSSASNFAKLLATAVDAAKGTASFSVVRNPYCNDRSFVPPEEED